jgi:hypothetical protein
MLHFIGLSKNAGLVIQLLAVDKNLPVRKYIPSIIKKY